MSSKAEDLALATEIRIAVSRMHRQFRKQITRFAVSMPEQSVMAILDRRGKMLPSELAGIEKVSAQSMSQTLNHLHALDFIHKKSDPDDKRKVVVSLSKKGKDTLAQMRHVRSEWLSNVMAGLSAEEKKLLQQSAALLQQLANCE
ncbi:DNA-binding transcriptional regulator, MarR family [Chitinophaga costaii]|uniref:DNA-binding transcriptional regulator, MarR family n=1 Tax=Chitinophaga costaii TaxID=1335309 RepID=A0A1C4FCC5_9BACT|nr:MarR family transcriptional regulator [Chitinophaga costaii]PUZ20697.1 MarR family transcriptional regulator [Chitinophaga costaii]SCC53484.1 DNA-binding transcriptional regulator, MarR family [Chitinophaga costaii]